jgi:protein-S-isoprenylcysteine O-methyltransferase Ste14
MIGMNWLTQDRADMAIRLAWLGLTSFWIWNWRRVKVTRRRESVGSKLSYTAIIIVGLALIRAPVGWRLLAWSPAVGWVAVSLNWAGVLFSIWSRTHLGRNWSATVTVKEGHNLTRTGPYRLVRHPIYFDMLLGILGLAIQAGRWPAVPGLALVFLGLRLKSRIEERLLREEFGREYENYRRDTPALVPYLP